MAFLTIKRGQTSFIFRIKLLDSASTVGAGKTALDHTAAGLIISTIADNEASATVYTSAGSTIETITTNGTYAAPTATKCRFKKIDDTNHKGLYEIQLADARFAVASAKSLTISIQATGVVETDLIVALTDLDPHDAVRAGLTALPNVASGSAGAIPTVGTGTAQISVTGGRANADVLYWNAAGVATPDTAGYVKVTLKTGTGTGEISLSSGQVTAVTSAADWLVPSLISGEVIERPVSSTQQYEILIALYNESSVLENADSAPTIAIQGSISGTSLNARLDSTTMTAVSTGLYRSLYTSDSAHSEEQLRLSITVTEGAVPRTFYRTIKIRDLVSSRLATGASITLSGTQTFNMVGNITGNLSGSVGSVTGSVGSVTGNVGGSVASISGITFPSGFGNLAIIGTKIAGVLTTDVLTTYTGNTVQTGDSFARIGAPAAASVSADIVNLQTDSTAIKAKTDSLTFTVANVVNANSTYIEGRQLSAKVGDNFEVFFQNAGGTTTSLVDDVGTGGAGTTDWSATERNQIRYRLGVDGTASAPTATPNLGSISVSLTGTQTFNMVGSITGNITGNILGDISGDLLGSVAGGVGHVIAPVNMPDIDSIPFEQFIASSLAPISGESVWGALVGASRDYTFISIGGGFEQTGTLNLSTFARTNVEINPT